MRRNPFDLKLCATAFGVVMALGVGNGMALGDDRVTSSVLVIGFGIFVLGALWNLLFFAIDARARQSRRWEAQGRCPNCGYDNQSGTCPECGLTIWT
jgi:hypothetical protein